ncbi:unnamed protein product [Vicia faba]|uniref:Uncharacterized protein n=1 Tax=Vicia faba TaxID=3906 RepID=A0AAV1AEC5_VICFA|nr:unnamed protein product [Vicia faba]
MDERRRVERERVSSGDSEVIIFTKVDFERFRRMFEQMEVLIEETTKMKYTFYFEQTYLLLPLLNKFYFNQYYVLILVIRLMNFIDLSYYLLFDNFFDCADKYIFIVIFQSREI